MSKQKKLILLRMVEESTNQSWRSRSSIGSRWYAVITWVRGLSTPSLISRTRPVVGLRSRKNLPTGVAANQEKCAI